MQGPSGSVRRLPEHQSIHGAKTGTGPEETQRSFDEAVEFGAAKGS